jgi:hypothetical protein
MWSPWLWIEKRFPWGNFGALHLGEGETYSGEFGESRGLVVWRLGDRGRSYLELPSAVLAVRTDTGSFDFACVARCETHAALRMTGQTKAWGALDRISDLRRG